LSRRTPSPDETVAALSLDGHRRIARPFSALRAGANIIRDRLALWPIEVTFKGAKELAAQPRI
jgi:hypothetical protein